MAEFAVANSLERDHRASIEVTRFAAAVSRGSATDVREVTKVACSCYCSISPIDLAAPPTGCSIGRRSSTHVALSVTLDAAERAAITSVNQKA